jgi:L-ribulokinase
MGIVAGIDFGTQSVRVSLYDRQRGRLGAGTAEYAVGRDPGDVRTATQRHDHHLTALELATKDAIADARVDGRRIGALAVATTSSTIVPVDETLRPLDDYYLWCDQRATEEAARITRVAVERNLPSLAYCGGVYGTEMAWAKLLHWLRHNRARRDHFATAVEHGDLIVATLCGVEAPDRIVRGMCAAGHKWLWHPEHGGLPPEEFFAAVDPLLSGVRAKLSGKVMHSREIAGRLSEAWAARLGLSPGIPIPPAGIDAHWDAVGAGIQLGDIVNVVGTSTCVMALSQGNRAIPGVSGVARGSIDPDLYGIEAGLSAVGDVFEAIARRSGQSVAALCDGLDQYHAGQTGLLRILWDRGDRTVLANPVLSGMTLGWNLQHTAKDELFAAIEGSGFHTRIIVDQMVTHGVPVQRVIHAGGIPQKNAVLNQIYANILDRPVLVPHESITGLGSAIFAFLASHDFGSISEAQIALCPSFATFVPDPSGTSTYRALFSVFHSIYFAFGDSGAKPITCSKLLPALAKRNP